jgi:DNA-binding transcriptional LysR family regulator
MRLSPADLRGLIVFRAIVEHRGFTGAQLALGMSQSTVSFHLKALEERLGFQLCRRGRGGFRLSARGEEVFEKSKSLIAAISNFESMIGELRHQIVGTLRAGFVDNTITNPDLPLDAIIQACLIAAPEAEIQLTIANPEVLVTEVVNGAIDIAVTPQIDVARGLEQRHFYDEVHSLYCGDRHHLFALEKDPTISQVVECSFVARPYASKRELRHFPDVTVRVHASNMEAQAAFILSGRTIGYLPDHFAQRWVSSGRMRPLLPSTRFRSPFVLITSAETTPSPLMRLFIREVTWRATGNPKTRKKAA